jgi:type IV pilus assembly protein PilB
VGEIRDHETARSRSQASLTGHLVFSTLHTNDAPSAITRTGRSGARAVPADRDARGIIAQRLVRRVCKDCKTAYQPDDKVLMELDLDPAEIAGRSFSYGKGCESCNHTGYRGRTALFEMMRITEDVKNLILDQAPTSMLRAQARRDGMRTLRESGLLAIYDGHTTVEEVLRETL